MFFCFDIFLVSRHRGGSVLSSRRQLVLSAKEAHCLRVDKKFCFVEQKKRVIIFAIEIFGLFPLFGMIISREHVSREARFA